MPSAKMEAKKEEKAEGELDAKARIKAAILNAGLRRKQIGTSCGTTLTRIKYCFAIAN